MVGWHHRLDGRGFGWTLGVGDGQGDLACYSPWYRCSARSSKNISVSSSSPVDVLPLGTVVLSSFGIATTSLTQRPKSTTICSQRQGVKKESIAISCDVRINLCLTFQCLSGIMRMHKKVVEVTI